MRKGIISGALVLVFSLPGAGRAQHWDTPTFFAPRLADDIGAYLVDAKGGDLGLVGIWRQSGNVSLGVRAGFGGHSGDRTILVGAELFGMLVEPEPGRSLAVAWMTGAGASFDGVTALRIPAGVTIGAQLYAGTLAITPYAHPRVSLDFSTYDNADGEEETDTEFNLDVDLGGELQVGENWLVRAAVTLGDQEAFGLGLAYRIPRRVAVR